MLRETGVVLDTPRDISPTTQTSTRTIFLDSPDDAQPNQEEFFDDCVIFNIWAVKIGISFSTLPVPEPGPNTACAIIALLEALLTPSQDADSSTKGTNPKVPCALHVIQAPSNSFDGSWLRFTVRQLRN